MAINDEFLGADLRKGDARADFTSSADISAALRMELDGEGETHEATARLFDGSVSSVEAEVDARDPASGIAAASRHPGDPRPDRDAEVPQGETPPTAADDFRPSPSSSRDLEVPGDDVDAPPGPMAGADAPSAGRRLAQNAALGIADAILSDEESVASQGWQTARRAERVIHAARDRASLRAGAESLALESLDLGDGDNVIREARDAARHAKGAYRTGRAVKALISDRKVARGAGKAENASTISAKQKSMNIARGISEGRAVSDMSLGMRLKMMAGQATAVAASSIAQLMTALGGLVGAAAPVLVPMAAIILLFVTIFAGGAVTRKKAPAGLTEVEGQVYSFFSDKGLDDLHVAAIMGNMHAESGGYPSNLQHVAGPENPCPNGDILALGNAGGKAAGLFQWDSGRRYRLAAYAESVGRPWHDAGVQLDFFWDHDEWQGNWGYGQYTKSRFLATDDLETAVRIFCKGWERAGVERLDDRLEAATGYLNKFKSGGGQSLAGATAAQNAVYNSCLSTPSPGAGYCAMWVSRVFAACGYPYPGGNANDMYWKWCTSDNLADLKVGMIVAVPSHSHDSAGMQYGHVAIYVGDGKVMENIGDVVETPLSTWMAYYGTTYPVKWGWVFGTDLSK